MKRTKVTLATVALVVQQTACGGATLSGPIPSEGSPEAGANAQPTPLTVQGVVRAPDGAAVPGAQVCLERGTSASAVMPIDCASSGPSGSFALSDADAGASATLTIRASGFLPMLYPFATQWSRDVTVPPLDSTLVEDRGTLLGVAIDVTRGQVPFVVTVSGSPLVPRVTAISTDVDYLAGAAGPVVPAVFGDENGSAVPGATEGTAGAFLNLSPGTHAMKFESSGAQCIAGLGMPGSTSGLTSASTLLYTAVRGGYVMAPIVIACFVP
jgi:hypothetical protein